MAIALAGAPALAQQEGFGGDDQPASGETSTDEAAPDDDPEPQDFTGDAEALSGALESSGGGATMPLFQEPEAGDEIYPSAPLDDAPPAALEPEASEEEPSSTEQSPEGDLDGGAAEEELYEAEGKQAWVQPLDEVEPDPPPDGWNNWGASALQYGTGLCSACACCGTSGLIGGVALAAGIVIPGGSVLFGPLVGCLGCVSVVGAPGVGSSAAVVLREWLGIWRGPWAWTLAAAYVVELLAVAVIAAGALAATALLAGFLGSVQGQGGFYDINPVDTWAWDQAGLGAGVFVSTFAAGLLFAIIAPSAAATVVYQFMGEQKHTYDIGFRIPGLFSPNHPEPPRVIKPDTKGHERNRARPAPEPASMRF